MSDSRDPYEVLGVPRDASPNQIRAAYVAKAWHAHPDLVGRKGLDMMRALNEAWEVLKDESRKMAWDLANQPAAFASNGSTIGPDGVERPFWTGAMGPAPGRPFGPVLTFGIYDGWSLGEIVRSDRGYLMWLRDRPEGAAMRADIARLLEPESHDAPTSRFGRR